MASVVTSMTTVFTEVFEWLQTALTSVLSVFYAEGQLTVLGVLAVIGLAIAIFMLIMNVISNFFHLRG